MRAEPAHIVALKREIGPIGSAALAFNGLVGTGIFALPAALAMTFSGWSPFLFLSFGAAALLIVIAMARAAAMFEGSGGPVAYAREAFGPLASFQLGWIYYVARVSAFAANTLVFVDYAGALLPGAESQILRLGLALALIAALTLVNVIGVKSASRLLDAVTLLKGLPLLATAVIGLLLFAGNAPAPGPLPAFSTIEANALLIFYAFIGFETSVVPAGETKDPTKTIPRALVTTVALTAFLYFLVQYAYLAVMTGREVAEATRPLVTVANVVFGPVGGLVMAGAVLFSVAGNSMGSMLSTPRITFALAEAKAFPAWFGAISARFATPANSILFMGAAAGLLTATGSFAALAVMSTLARLIVYLVSAAALPMIRWRRRAAGLGVDLAFAGGGAAICLWAIAQAPWPAWRVLLIFLAIGLALFGLALALRRGGGRSF